MVATHIRELAMPGVEGLAGPANEVRERLKAADHAHVLTLVLEQTNQKFASAFTEALRLIVPMILNGLVVRDHDMLERLVAALVPQVPLSEDFLVEARMNAEARAAVWTATDWLTAAQLSEIAGFTGANASAQPNRWKRERKIFALRRDGSDYFPGFALDRAGGYRPLKGLMPILEAFDKQLDEWDMAIWFVSANSFLGGACPMDLLATQPERVLDAAWDEVAGVLHG